LPPLRTISTPETEGFEKRKNIFFRKACQNKKDAYFCTPLRALRGLRLRVESLKRGIKKKVLKKLARIKKMLTFAPRLTTEGQQESG
jgi:hypothetical protein